MHRGPTALLLLCSVLAASLPGLAGSPPPRNHPFATPPIDLDPWFVGDSWTYDTTIRTASPDGTRITTVLSITSTVAQVRSETVGNLTYTIYNSTSSGSASANGVLSLTGPGANPFSLSGPVTGWSWSDRSNLASVALNQTTNQTGTVQVGFLIFPVDVDATTTVRYLPALEEFDFPLELQDAWSYDGIANATGVAVITGGPFGTTTQNLTGEANASYRAWFNATEDAVVPGGTFLGAARVHAVAPDGNATDRWYHPDARNFVKLEVHRQSAPNDYFHLWTNLTSYALVSPPPWPGSITLNPSRVAPGSPLVASGVAQPDQDLILMIPATGAVFPVRAGSAGAWSLPLLAPTVDDFTPADGDVGSHGILIEPAVSPPGWDVTTLQLIRPDLYVAAGDLLPSDASPLLGTIVWFNGTVHAANSVDVSSPFNVSTSVDGVEISRVTVGPIAANASASASAAWTATTAGTHSVTFAADPDDSVHETDETNNTVGITILVRGPDLSPWNITIEAEGNVTYADPSTVGFVSSPMAGRVGATVNVTFEASNVGEAAVIDAFEVEVVETQGLRGSPITGWRFSENVTSVVAPGDLVGPWTAMWPVPSTPGPHYLNVTADAGRRVPESSEVNNTFVVIVIVSGPDYAIVGVSGPAKVTSGASVSFSVNVRNVGQLDGGVTVSLAAYEGISPIPFYSTNVGLLAVGEAVAVPVPWTSPSAAIPMDLHFVADPNSVLPEMDETNNGAVMAIDVRGPPITTIRLTGPNVTTDRLYVRNSTQFSMEAQDLSGEGYSTYYRVDSSGAVLYTVPFSLSGDGPRTIAYWSEDLLGGVEVDRLFASTVDDIPPSTGLARGAFMGNRTVVTLNASDGGGVGVERIEYRVDNGTWHVYVGPFPIEGFGDHAVDFRATDRLGNEESLQHRTVTILPRSGPPRLPTNYKPILAAAFAAIIFVLALIPRPPEGYARSRRVQAGVAFGAAELATGVASFLWRAFEISSAVSPFGTPAYAVGVSVDLAIFLGGIFLMQFFRRRSGEV